MTRYERGIRLIIATICKADGKYGRNSKIAKEINANWWECRLIQKQNRSATGRMLLRVLLYTVSASYII